MRGSGNYDIQSDSRVFNIDSDYSSNCAVFILITRPACLYCSVHTYNTFAAKLLTTVKTYFSVNGILL